MWGRGKKDARCWMFHITSFATCSEHVRNTLATSFVECCKTTVRNIGKALHNIAKVVHNICYGSQCDRRLIGSLHPNRAAQDPSDASTRIGRLGASSFVFLFQIHLIHRRVQAELLLRGSNPNLLNLYNLDKLA
jgi:hypothetical protein